MAENDPSKSASHRADQYGDINARSEDEAGITTPIPSATVVLAKDVDGQMQVLMLRKNSKIAFGGMWVFPGGKIDAADHDGAASEQEAAQRAAAREAEEEAGVQLDVSAFTQFAHWTPPPSKGKRFATYFFAAQASIEAIAIDDGEIKEYRWIAPADALALHDKGEIDLAPPTWMTLQHFAQHTPTVALMDHLADREVRTYATRAAVRADGVRVAMWYGDAGYESWDADAPGARHRLVMAPNAFTLENTVEVY